MSRYRLNENLTDDKSSDLGLFILKPGVNAALYRPSWSYTYTTFRIFPGRNPEKPDELDPFRLSDAPFDFGDWIRRYDAVRGWGDPGVTFIYRDPRNHDEDKQQSPVWQLYTAVSRAVKSRQAPPHWVDCVKGTGGSRRTLSKPSHIFLVQGILTRHRSKPLPQPIGVPGTPTCVLVLPPTAGTALLTELEKKDEQGKRKYEDIVALDGGEFVDFYQAGTQQVGQTGLLAGGVQPTLMTGGQSTSFAYEVTIGNGQSAAIAGIAGITDQIFPWDSAIRVLSIEEQVRMLCSCGLPADMLAYGLRERFGEMLPESVRQAYSPNRSQASFTYPQQQQFGFGQQPAAPQQPPAQQQPAFGQQPPAQQQPVFGQQPAASQQPAFGQQPAAPQQPAQQFVDPAALGQAPTWPPQPPEPDADAPWVTGGTQPPSTQPNVLAAEAAAAMKQGEQQNPAASEAAAAAVKQEAQPNPAVSEAAAAAVTQDATQDATQPGQTVSDAAKAALAALQQARVRNGVQ